MEYIYAAAIVFFATTLQGISGFGSGLVSVPLLVLLLPMTTITPTLSIVNVFLSGIIYYKNRHAAHPRQWLSLLGAGFIFSILGSLLLVEINEQIIQGVLGTVILTVVAVLASGRQLPTFNHPTGHASVGAASGILNGLMTLGGPPIILFLANAKVDKTAFRATLALFFLVIAIANVLTFGARGVYQSSHLDLLWLWVPCAVLGAMLGQYVQQFVVERQFKRLILGLMLLSGLSVLFQAIGSS
ncbi:hypothetical protein DFP83_101397 [Idiomarina fontislapidosi]|uniref:Probable membrane transporter protein n=1 Tax=Idiomarina fontislapidosi TaxID=263723 RepID=A0A432YBN4_9GAMM|nr:sulfite exporter TauE/SafE family protein [Idiomarina fontislapidosi]PYE35508.1 hypothetical protein DFP83_101397 [Idiomarina fontislapidosi]RUO58389.1 sulfite exporter TauE/SafE family protein [Idiomarina fontislapidosi]